MNERIKQLAEQAHEYSCAEYTKRLETETADKIFFNKIFNQKFAELIVRECATIMDKDVDHPYNSRGSILKYHFGVEE